jgi:hypothetical protein
MFFSTSAPFVGRNLRPLHVDDVRPVASGLILIRQIHHQTEYRFHYHIQTHPHAAREP